MDTQSTTDLNSHYRAAVRRRAGQLGLGWLLGALLASGCVADPQAEADDEQTTPRISAPRSLQGTDVDGALHVDAQGRFVFDDDARRLFDYVLATEGELEDDALMDLARAEINQRLHGAAADAAWAQFVAYVDYRHEAGALLETRDLEDIANLALELQSIRVRTVGTESPLPDEIQVLNRAVALRQIQRNRALDPSVRRAQVEAILDQTGEAFDPQAPARQLVNLRVAQAQLGEAPDPDTLHNLRTERVGEAAAVRLKALDAQRAQWRQRIEQYRVARAKLVETTDPATLDQAIVDLRAQHFGAREQLRVSALERHGSI